MNQPDPLYDNVEYIGPFSEHIVVINGRKVPYLTVEPPAEGQVWISLDNRFSIQVAEAQAENLLTFIANCIAVAAGYTCHPRADSEPIRRQLFTRIHGPERLPEGTHEPA